jgi:eukaryotic-like serine/threonine-protein kinase
MTLGETLGPYRVLEKLGAGGMGEVYRARDSKLNRDVAIKILPEALATDSAALARFECEAQAVAALSHPNILAIFDFGRQGDTAYAVMELLEGETLRARLAHGALPARKAGEIAVQIAEGLAAAHEKGIVHRDLKPENIFVSGEGRAKILDFGLAKMTRSASSPDAGTQMATGRTGPGTVLGTVGYMSPEQVRGDSVDHRSDIFAFGAVLYEMLAGRQAFGRETATESMTAILKEDPPEISATGSSASPALSRIVQHCLEKKPGERFQSARDIAFALQALSGTGSGPVVARAGLSDLRRLSARAVWLVSGALIASALAGVVWWRSSTPAAQTMHFSAPFTFSARDIAVAPNGRTVAVVGHRESARKDVISLYDVGSPDARSLADSEGATFPFWAPDGKFLAFFADGKLKKMDIAGGPAQTLCDAPSGRGGTWNKQGVIVFAPSGMLLSGLYRIPASGGTPTPISTPDANRGENTHRWPMFLPDGRHFLYLAANVTGASDPNGIFMGLLDSNEKRFVVKTSTNAAYAAPGYLLFYRDNTLFGQRFDVNTLGLTGEPVAILTDIQYLPRIARTVFAVSDNGLLFAQKSSEASRSRLVWFDRKGNEVGAVGTPDLYANVVLARNGTSVAVDKTDNGTQNTDVWTYDLRRNSTTKLTFDPAIDAMPVWSPDGSKVMFSSSRQHMFDLYLKDADGAKEEQLVVHGGADDFPTDWSRDGKYVLYMRARDVWWDLWFVSFPELKSRLFLKTSSTVKNGQFSPDGRWVAYASNETGKWEIYVTSFPQARSKWQLSTGGGEQPRWAGNGKEIFFLSPDGTMMTVPVRTGATFDAGAPAALFQANVREPAANSEQAMYDVDATGQRFLINTPVKKATTQPLSIVLNWNAGLKK